jgi:DNA-binding transcriptional LysR family regulator
MDTRRLPFLVELSRLGSMRAVAAELGVTTSTVSQQVAALAAEAGTALIERDGRRVRLTPAGHRLAEHAVGILAAVDSARLDLDPAAEPVGTLRVGGFATAIRRSLMPIVADLADTHPRVDVAIHEYEPLEAFDLLARDELDLALTYDYNLAPASLRNDFVATALWSLDWGLAVPIEDTSARFAAYADRPWIVNSRNTADEEAVRTLASLAGYTPRIAHRIDSLELVEQLIGAGLGVALMPIDWQATRGVHVLPLAAPGVTLRAYAVIRAGRDAWPPLRLVVGRLTL